MSPEDELQDKLSLYLSLLRKWQKSLNLVSPASLDEARTRHIADSLQLAAFIPVSSSVSVSSSSRRKPGSSQTRAAADPGFRRDDGVGREAEGVGPGPGFRRDDMKRSRDDGVWGDKAGERDGGKTAVFDLGSGGGFPGMVLAMARPDLCVTLVESDTKKCTFLSTVSRETKTPVTILNQRIESVCGDSIPAFITARALAPLDKLLGLCLGFAARNPGLVMLFLKGARAEEEIAQARTLYDFSCESFPSETAAEGRILRISGLAGKES